MLGNAGRAVLVLALVAATAAIAFTIGRGRGAAVVGPTATAPAAIPDRVTLADGVRADAGIEVEAARASERTDALEATAVLALDEARTARIGSVVDGIVVRTLVEVGDRVRPGTLLAELHSHVVHDAWADYRRSLAERRRLDTELTYARDAEARAGRLLAEKAISVQERERAVANRQAAEEQLDMARTEVRRSEEALEHLGITSGDDPTGETGERIPSRTPLGGVVLERSVTPGTAVTPGMPMFVVSDLAALWALAEIDERHLGAVSVGRAITLRVAAFADEVFAGTIAFVGDTVNPKTRRVVIRCAVPNPGSRLKPGMFATVGVETGVRHRALTVPGGAVQELDGQRVLFVEQQPGTFVVRRVTLGAEREGRVEVTAGLVEGERVVSRGAFLLKSELLKAVTPDEG
jgi:cobalt-zinc-cadmium efflux system membrane fusion protein